MPKRGHEQRRLRRGGSRSGSRACRRGPRPRRRCPRPRPAGRAAPPRRARRRRRRAGGSRVDETPSTCGATRVAMPEALEQREVAAAARGRSGTPRPRRRPRRRSRRRYDSTNSSGASAASSGVNSTTSVSSTPSSASSSSRRSSVESSDTWLPSTSRGCGWKVTTVGSGPASIAVRTTERWPRWTPSNVPIATARGRRSSSPRRARRPFTARPPRASSTRARGSPRARGATRLGRAGARAPRTTGMQPLRVGLLDPERPDRGAPQRPAVPAERLRDRAHVRARS